MTKRNKMWLMTMSILLVSCKDSDIDFKEKLSKTLKENPKIITKIMEENPKLFVETFQKMVRNSRQEQAKKEKELREKELLNSINNPLRPLVTKDDVFRGTKEGPITIVEYTDFQCPFCEKNTHTLKKLMKRYPGKVRVLYKHFPLDFHPQAMIAAQYYEAIKIQDPKKAFEFHDLVFKDQIKLRKGELFLDKMVKKVGAKISKVKKDINSKRVIQKIEADATEIKKFNIQGAPGVVLNGVLIRGAYPIEHYEKIIGLLQEKGKLEL